MRSQVFVRVANIITMLSLLFNPLNGQYDGAGTFDKIDALENLESGTYYIFYGINGGYSGAMTNTISGGRMGSTSITPSGSAIINPSTSIVWYVTGNSGDGYTIYNEAVDKYCEITASSTSGFSLNSSSTHTYTVSYDAEDKFFFMSNHASAGNRGIALYQSDFRPYVSGNTLELYKFTPPTSDPEPTNHVLSFTATADGHNRIDLTWSDNDGENQASGFLILVNTSGTFSPPSDGIAQADDSDFSDGAGVKNIPHGEQASNFTGLSAETTYYFKIYPYSNSGENIDYKTDGSIPTASVTTAEQPPVLPSTDVFISEVCDEDQGGYSTAFLEIFNNSSNTFDMENAYIERWQLGSYDSYTYTFSSGVTIPANGLLVVARGTDQTTFETAWNISFSSINAKFDAGHSSLYQTTGRGYKLFTSSNVLVDETSGDVTDSKRDVQISVGNWLKDLSPSTGTPGTLDNDQSLPVTLSRWEASSKSGMVQLSWTTDSEIENLGFIIDRALTEKGPWRQIADFNSHATLKGQGSTNTVTEYSFTDEAVEVGETYYYRLSDVDYKGTRTEHDAISVTVSDKDQNALPGGFQLEKIFPNPFNPSVTIDFTVVEPTAITVNVFDLQGRLVNDLIERHYAAGNYQIQWNGLTHNGQPAPSGIYLLQIRDEASILVRKVILAR